MSDIEDTVESAVTGRLRMLKGTDIQTRAESLHWFVQQGLRGADSCGVVVGLETEYQIIRAEAVESWLADETRRHRFLFLANRNTTVEDVLWQLNN